MMIMGIDVGQNGGIALVNGDRRLVDAIRMPTMMVRTKQAVDGVRVVEWADKIARPDRVVIELVSAMPRQGVASTFQFGRMLGGIEAVVQLWGVPIQYATPAVWKRAMGLGSNKQDSIDAAHTAFGARGRELIRYKADDGLAEAALLALYSLQTEGD